MLRQVTAGKEGGVIEATHQELGKRYLHAQPGAELLFTENETNTELLVGVPNATPYVKDGIGNCVVHGPERPGESDAAGDEGGCTLCVDDCGWGVAESEVAAGEAAPAAGAKGANLGRSSIRSCQSQRDEADEFYAGVIPASLSADESW